MEFVLLWSECAPPAPCKELVLHPSLSAVGRWGLREVWDQGVVEKRAPPSVCVFHIQPPAPSVSHQ